LHWVDSGWVPAGLAISNAKNKIYGNNFIKQDSEAVMVLKNQKIDCSLKKTFYFVTFYNFWQTFVRE